MKVALIDTLGDTVPGLVTEAGIVRAPLDLAALKRLLAEDALEHLAEACAGLDPHLGLEEATYRPLTDLSERVFCVGINYPKKNPMGGHLPPPEDIILFTKVPGTLVGHGAPLERPAGDPGASFDYEGEIAIVIGKAGRNIPEDAAMAHVAGYTIVNDGSVRAWQKHSLHAGKNFANSGACGPWMVSAEEIDDPGAMRLTTALNGEIVQDTTLAELVFSIPQVIAYLSCTIDLRPGDLISTGSPEGSGASRDPKRFLLAGDELEIAVSGVGTLRNSVVQA